MRTSADLLASCRHRCRLLAVVALCLVGGTAYAQTVAGDDAGDPPARAARLSYIAGDLGFLPAGATHWSDASVNRPLTSGDRLSTGQGSRAELDLGGGTLRMAGRTEFGVLELSDAMAQFELTSGSLSITVRDLYEGQSYEIDTPTVALVIDQPGTFRIDIGDDGGSSNTRVSVFDGRATVYGENNAQQPVLAGRNYRYANSSLAAVTVNDIGDGDAFDMWSGERDREYAQSNSSQYVGDDVVGYQDLDQYGDWQETDDYGAVWFPTDTAADWGPYSDGHWAYILPWGWTWIDNSPWGFAPYHYGRWAYLRHRWGWIPGRRGVRSNYAPAIVAFVGGRGRAGGRDAPVGWFPLGPGEIYNPWYRCGRRCYTDVNVNNIRGRRDEDQASLLAHVHDRYGHYRSGTADHDEHYANRDVPRGFTAVSGQAFAGGQNIRHGLLHVDSQKLASAPVLSRGINIRPAPGAIASPRSAHARVLPLGGFQRDVVAHHEPMSQSSTALHGAAGMRRNTAGNNVRVLNPQSAHDRANASSTFGHATSGTGDLGHSSHLLPVVPKIDAAATERDPTTFNARHGELPSSRFAHPQPRSGEGTISRTGDREPAETYRGDAILPAESRTERAAAMHETMPMNDRGSERILHNDTLPDMPTPAESERRVERESDAGQTDFRSSSRPAYPAREEPVRQNSQPRYEPMQRAAPEFRSPSHGDRSAPERSESHSAGRSESSGSDNSHKH
ncbi:FecR family protein [Rhodanobacter sp. L36]|uniref:FecR family protein n=1 Tax=Rhodanobacter sp. L36 TaxID=1747221 RepID=UPI00131AB6BE|nr:FecR family protein [Rhodanobacter sp. L36]